MKEPMSTCGVPDGCQQQEVCPLNQLKAGASGRIRRLAASPEDSTRLRELGFCEDQEVKLVSRHANIICQICNARLGISAQLAGSILVEPLRPAGRQFALA